MVCAIGKCKPNSSKSGLMGSGFILPVFLIHLTLLTHAMALKSSYTLIGFGVSCSPLTLPCRVLSQVTLMPDFGWNCLLVIVWWAGCPYGLPSLRSLSFFFLLDLAVTAGAVGGQHSHVIMYEAKPMLLVHMYKVLTDKTVSAWYIPSFIQLFFFQRKKVQKNIKIEFCLLNVAL